MGIYFDITDSFQKPDFDLSLYEWWAPGRNLILSLFNFNSGCERFCFMKFAYQLCENPVRCISIADSCHNHLNLRFRICREDQFSCDDNTNCYTEKQRYFKMNNCLSHTISEKFEKSC